MELVNFKFIYWNCICNLNLNWIIPHLVFNSNALCQTQHDLSKGKSCCGSMQHENASWSLAICNWMARDLYQPWKCSSTIVTWAGFHIQGSLTPTWDTCLISLQWRGCKSIKHKELVSGALVFEMEWFWNVPFLACNYDMATDAIKMNENWITCCFGIVQIPWERTHPRPHPRPPHNYIWCYYLILNSISVKIHWNSVLMWNSVK